MKAAGLLWQRLTGVAVRWETRSLASFGSQPLATLAGDYDIIVIDHPLIGEAAAEGVLVPLDLHIDASRLEDLAAHTAGPSYRSYTYGGHQWALPVDGACQVTAVRPDRLGGTSLPQTWEEVAKLARQRPHLVALPMQPAHALSALCTLCANAGSAVGQDDAWLSSGAARHAIELLQICTAGTAARFADADPPDVLDALTSDNGIGYVPLTYGYVTYSIPNQGRSACRAVNIPSGPNGPAGSTLGGAGLAVPARSQQREAALSFAQWACSSRIQRELIAAHGGQPAHSSAWEDPAINSHTGQFYAATRQTIDSAWVRPREPWWPVFQRRGGNAVRRGVLSGRAPAQVTAELRSIWETALGTAWAPRRPGPGAAGETGPLSGAAG